MSPHPTAADRDAIAAKERAAMVADIERLTDKVEKLSTDIEGLVEAWRNANFAVSLIKWLASVIMAGSALWFVITNFGQGK